MKQEDRRLLIKDIIGRIQYGVKFDFDGLIGAAIHICCCPIYNENGIDDCICELDIFGGGGDNFIDIEYLKPYLFPLSSMTEEQKEEYNQSRLKDLRMLNSVFTERISDGSNFDSLVVAYNEIDWLNKNHFDYRGLINKGFAIDCTGLKIY